VRPILSGTAAPCILAMPWTGTRGRFCVHVVLRDAWPLDGDASLSANTYVYSYFSLLLFTVLRSETATFLETGYEIIVAGICIATAVDH